MCQRRTEEARAVNLEAAERKSASLTASTAKDYTTVGWLVGSQLQVVLRRHQSFCSLLLCYFGIS